MHHRGQLMLLQRLIGQVPPLTRQRQAMMAQLAGRGDYRSGGTDAGG